MIKDKIVKALRHASVFNPDVQVAPACILWPELPALEKGEKSDE